MRVICFGKEGKEYAEQIRSYSERIRHYSPFDVLYVRNAKNARHAMREARVVCVEEDGRRMGSEAFSSMLGEHMRDSVFVVGGAEGVPHEIREAAHDTIRLSDMTFPHQLARLMLIEQIYRALTIRNNHPYHK